MVALAGELGCSGERAGHGIVNGVGIRVGVVLGAKSRRIVECHVGLDDGAEGQSEDDVDDLHDFEILIQAC